MATQRPARLDVGIVGTGRVGAVLGAALQQAGHRLVAASGVSQLSRGRAAALLPGIPVMSVEEVVTRAELVLLTVPDDVLPGLVAGLSATASWQAGQLVVHTSGRYGTAIFDAAAGHHILGLALHPAMTFTGTSMDLLRLVDCCFGITAPAALRPVAEALVVEMGAEPVWIEEQDRPLYHAGHSHGANHLVTLVAAELQVGGSAGVAAGACGRARGGPRGAGPGGGGRAGSGGPVAGTRRAARGGRRCGCREPRPGARAPRACQRRVARRAG